MIKYRYSDQLKRCIRIGDIVLLREGAVQMAGEVIFREKSKSLAQGIDMGVGLHVRVLFELRQEEGKIGMIEGSRRIIRDVAPDSLRLLGRGKNSVRYSTGEPIMDGDLVAEVHDHCFSLHLVHLYVGNGDEGEKISRMGMPYIELCANLKDDPPGEKTPCGPAQFAYWTEDGFPCEQIERLIFICRGAKFANY